MFRIKPFFPLFQKLSWFTGFSPLFLTFLLLFPFLFVPSFLFFFFLSPFSFHLLSLSHPLFFLFSPTFSFFKPIDHLAKPLNSFTPLFTSDYKAQSQGLKAWYMRFSSVNSSVKKLLKIKDKILHQSPYKNFGYLHTIRNAIFG